MLARRQVGVQCGFGRGWGVEAVVAGLRALRAPSQPLSQSVAHGLRIVVALMEEGRERATPSLSRGGSDGPELVGCVSCASCAVLKLQVTSYQLAAGILWNGTPHLELT